LSSTWRHRTLAKNADEGAIKMTVDEVKNATTRESAVHYKVTVRVWSQDLDKPEFEKELAARVRKAIDGLND